MVFGARTIRRALAEGLGLAHVCRKLVVTAGALLRAVVRRGQIFGLHLVVVVLKQQLHLVVLLVHPDVLGNAIAAYRQVYYLRLWVRLGQLWEIGSGQRFPVEQLGL